MDRVNRRASGTAADFTALGGHVNVAAHSASQARAREVLASQAAYHAAGIETEGLRVLELKGKSELVSVSVLHAG